MRSKSKRKPLRLAYGCYSPPSLAGTLYIVSTPIGNLEDMSFRAVRTLKEVALIACEDTRVTQKLLNHFEIDTKSTSYHAHSTAEKTDRMIERLQENQDIALVSDAGTPMISDPGSQLVARAQEEGISVVPIPGASAVLSALVGSGLSLQHFLFLGFLPRTRKGQKEVLAPLKQFEASLVIYESPNRTEATLNNCLAFLGDRQACVARELTKKFETFEHGRISELLERLSFPLRGEIVVVLEPGKIEVPCFTEEDILESAQDFITSGTSTSDAAKGLMHLYGLKRKAAYNYMLKVKNQE